MDNQTTEVPVTATTDASNPAGLILAAPAALVKLDLGGGQNVAEGFDCVDLNAPNPVHRVNLFKFPWPFADNSVDEIYCSHFIEHIPAREVEARDIIETLRAPGGTDFLYEYVGKDMFFAFFDECYRIMKPDAFMTVVWPALKSVRAFQDPTHRRFIPMETMSYLSRDWRKAQALDHYRVNCHFTGDINFTTPTELGLLHPLAQEKYFRHYWEGTVDCMAKMKKAI